MITTTRVFEGCCRETSPRLRHKPTRLALAAKILNTVSIGSPCVLIRALHRFVPSVHLWTCSFKSKAERGQFCTSAPWKSNLKSLLRLEMLNIGVENATLCLHGCCVCHQDWSKPLSLQPRYSLQPKRSSAEHTGRQASLLATHQIVPCRRTNK